MDDNTTSQNTPSDPVEAAPAAAPAAATPSTERPRFGDYVMGMKGVVGVAVGSLLLGGLGGIVIGVGAEHRQSHERERGPRGAFQRDAQPPRHEMRRELRQRLRERMEMRRNPMDMPMREVVPPGLGVPPDAAPPGGPFRGQSQPVPAPSTSAAPLPKASPAPQVG